MCMQILAVFLLYELSKGQASFWGPYISQLPPRFNGYTTLPYFTAQQALELQAPPPSRDASRLLLQVVA